MQADVAGFYRGLQFPVYGNPSFKALANVGIRDHTRIPALGFRLVNSRVGLFQNVLYALVLVADRRSDGGRQVNDPSVIGNGTGDKIPDPAGQPGNFGQLCRTLQHAAEFVATDAKHAQGTVVGNQRLQAASQLDQGSVAATMTMPVIQFLELVEVNIKNARPGRFRIRLQGFNERIEGMPVFQSGEQVSGRLLFQLLFEFVANTHVMCDAMISHEFARLGELGTPTALDTTFDIVEREDRLDPREAPPRLDRLLHDLISMEHIAPVPAQPVSLAEEMDDLSGGIHFQMPVG